MQSVTRRSCSSTRAASSVWLRDGIRSAASRTLGQHGRAGSAIRGDRARNPALDHARPSEGDSRRSASSHIRRGRSRREAAFAKKYRRSIRVLAILRRRPNSGPGSTINPDGPSSSSYRRSGSGSGGRAEGRSTAGGRSAKTSPSARAHLARAALSRVVSGILGVIEKTRFEATVLTPPAAAP
jgi:hypothetical protein